MGFHMVPHLEFGFHSFHMSFSNVSKLSTLHRPQNDHDHDWVVSLSRIHMGPLGVIAVLT